MSARLLRIFSVSFFVAAISLYVESACGAQEAARAGSCRTGSAFSADAQCVADEVRGDSRVFSGVSAADPAKPIAPIQDSRTVHSVLAAEGMNEGAGAFVRRSIGHVIRHVDPFLLLDEFYVGKPAGFPDHPHRGFETVTYMLNGTFEHRDFHGHHGVINEGDVQWMTAGRGIVHSETPGTTAKEPSHGLQLWVNLRAEDKMSPPRYQELHKRDIPVATAEGVRVSIIAGSCLGQHAKVFTKLPVTYLDIAMEPHSSLHQPVLEGDVALAYVLEGRARVQTDKKGAFRAVGAHSLVKFGNDGRSVVLSTGKKSARIIFLSGTPTGEKVVQHGPFVMNSYEEIQQAIADYQYGRNGFEGR